jgi:hypothetical protein
LSEDLDGLWLLVWRLLNPVGQPSDGTCYNLLFAFVHIAKDCFMEVEDAIKTI